jgi:hypothetical protein
MIGRGLRTSGPTKALALAVMATIPGAAVSASAATIGATVVKGSVSAKAAVQNRRRPELLAPSVPLRRRPESQNDWLAGRPTETALEML